MTERERGFIRWSTSCCLAFSLRGEVRRMKTRDSDSQSSEPTWDVYLPDSCLQGEELPAHVLWLQSERVEITVSFSDSLELVSIFNVPGSGVTSSGDNAIEVSQFDVNGYLGLLF